MRTHKRTHRRTHRRTQDGMRAQHSARVQEQASSRQLGRQRLQCAACSVQRAVYLPPSLGCVDIAPTLRHRPCPMILQPQHTLRLELPDGGCVRDRYGRGAVHCNDPVAHLQAFRMCDDVIRRAHVSRSRGQQATAPRGHCLRGDKAIHQCPRADSRGRGRV